MVEAKDVPRVGGTRSVPRGRAPRVERLASDGKLPIRPLFAVVEAGVTAS